ncbi:hypothetical protein AVEN_48225-1, partial [Araneus ventricosus]
MGFAKAACHGLRNTRHFLIAQVQGSDFFFAVFYPRKNVPVMLWKRNKVIVLNAPELFDSSIFKNICLASQIFEAEKSAISDVLSLGFRCITE